VTAPLRRVTVILTCVLLLGGAGALTGCGVVPPDLTGLSLYDAQLRIESAGLTFGVATYDAGSRAATWTVVSQSPKVRAESGSAVDVVLAGAPPTTVPYVRGLSRQDAFSLVTSASLEPTLTGSTYSDSVPVGVVTSQTLEPGSIVPEGVHVGVTLSLGPKPPPTSTLTMEIARRLGGRLSPKSVVASQVGHVFAQNMIYGHTISVFDDKTYALLKTIPDKVTPADFGFPEYAKPVSGGPVEAAVTPDGRYMYVSNYSMYGPGFSRPGDDKGSPASGVDPSFVYRVRLDTLEVDQLIKVGSVPKFVAVTPDGRYLLVSNWISYSLSVVDTATGREVKEIRLGPYPRGIAVDPSSRYAYVAVMGSNDVAKVDLETFGHTWLKGVGSGPRHLNMSPDGAWLYATLNGAGKIAKIDVASGKVVSRTSTGSQPRSMTLSADGESLYVVNYASNTVSKVRTSDMVELQAIGVGARPIGITYVNATGEIWVACYTGSVVVLREF
jgi:YVTN family beta-propeller protein